MRTRRSTTASPARPRNDIGLVICAAVLAVFVVAGLLGVTVYREAAFAVSLPDSYQPPTLAHPMGTDAEGRDLLARVLYGAAISVSGSVAIMLLAAIVGVPLGLLAGVLRGAADVVFLRAFDSVLAFPTIILAICVSIGLGQGLGSAIVGIALSCVPFFGRLVRSEVIRVSAEPFVESALVLGASRLQLIVRHLLPHALPTVLVQSAAVIGSGSLMLAGLSFVGLGVAMPTPEWGAMITDGVSASLTGQWWVVVFPGLALMAFASTCHLLAERVRIVSAAQGTS